MPGQKGQNWAKPRNQPSREDVRCIICGKIFRRDKINSRHYTKVVKVEKVRTSLSDQVLLPLMAYKMRI
jgi:hypothetical protein